ncbi:MAG TPA: hypothetical protein VEX86_23250 [Longimicrobium sp.]|nr:hypothetical protein [Longimicrobium sp.]
MPSPAEIVASWGSIRLAPGWRAEERGDQLALLNGDPGALLLVVTFSLARTNLSARAWVRMAANVHPPKGRPLVPVSCGDFGGYRTEFASPDGFTAGWAPETGGDGRWLRGWLLECNGVPLSVAYTCPLAVAGRDDEQVSAMLDSLRIRRPVEFPA